MLKLIPKTSNADSHKMQSDKQVKGQENPVCPNAAPEQGVANTVCPNAEPESSELHTAFPNAEPESGDLHTASPNAEPEKPKTGKWKKGQSGNPAGRPRGSRNKASLLRAYLDDNQEDQLIQSVVDRALEGDTRAQALVLDRIMPRCKERSIEFEVGPIETYDQICKATTKLFQAIASGQITPSEGEKLVNVLEFQLEALVGIYQ